MFVNSGYASNQWIAANMAPIFKKGDKSVTSNDRPVCLTSVGGKMLGSILPGRIRDHLQKHDSDQDASLLQDELDRLYDLGGGGVADGIQSRELCFVFK